jgi:hypothetical protein
LRVIDFSTRSRYACESMCFGRGPMSDKDWNQVMSEQRAESRATRVPPAEQARAAPCGPLRQHGRALHAKPHLRIRFASSAADPPLLFPSFHPSLSCSRPSTPAFLLFLLCSFSLFPVHYHYPVLVLPLAALLCLPARYGSRPPVLASLPSVFTPLIISSPLRPSLSCSRA